MTSPPASSNLFHGMPSRLRGLILAIGLCAAATASAAADQVAVRLGSHEGYGRLVFEWPSPVGYKAAIEDGALVVRFERPFAGALDLLPRRLPAYVAQPRLVDDGKTLIVPLKKSYGLKSYADGRTIVVDLLDGGKTAAPPAATSAPQAPPAKMPPAAPPVTAAAKPSAPKLAVRAGDHPGFGRLVFDWPRNVDYDIAQDGERLRVEFSQPATVDVEALSRRLPKTVLSLAAESAAAGLTVAMTLPEGARLRHFRNGPSVVVDILADVGEPAPVKSVAPPAAKAVADPVPAKPAAPTATGTAEAPKPTPSEASAAAKAPVAPAVVIASTPVAPPAPASVAPTIAQPAAAPPATGFAGATAPPRNLLAAAKPPAVTAAPARNAPLAQAPLASRRLIVSTLGTAPAIGGLRFAWPADAPAALFERNGSLWAVFDRAVAAGVASNWPRTVGRPEMFSSAISTIVRWPLPADRYAALRRDEGHLLVEFAQTPPLPGPQIALEAQPNADAGPRMLLKSNAFGPVIETRDPEVGDRLWILPTMPVEGLSGERRFVEFQLLSSLQGAVVKSLSDDLIVRGAREGAEIIVPGGLRLSGALAASPQIAQPERAAARLQTQSGASVPLPVLAVRNTTLFNYAGWSQFGGASNATFFERKSNLQRAVIEAPRAMRNSARLALARFLFANGQAADALGILQVMEEEEPEVSRDPAYVALRGASRYQMGDYAGAGPDLFHNGLDLEREAALWRAALLASQQDWIAAARYFARAETLLRDYPADMQLPFGLLAAEAALSIGDVGLAKFHLDALSYLNPERVWTDQIDYLRGEILLKTGEVEAALAAWDRAINGLHPPSKARARLARVETLLGNKRMSLPDAIAELERLRYGWRGDEVELTVLRRLGELYIESNDYKNGLATLRDALAQFPKASETTAIAQRMRESFADLYIGGAADKLPPLTALSIYEDFRDLTPSGDAGNLLIAKLADRLVQIELLDRAQTLLKGQIDGRLKGAAQAEAANQLALVYLLDRKPEEALATLAPALPADAAAALPADAAAALQTERRQLRARTLGELVRYDEALALLKDDGSADADRLRAEIGWRTQNWALAASAFGRLAPGAGRAATDAERQTVLRLAIAQSLSQDVAGLAATRGLYGAAMAKSAFKESFELITAATVAPNFDLRSISRQVAGVDQFSAFMTGYREKILKTRGAAAARAGADQAAANPIDSAPARIN